MTFGAPSLLWGALAVAAPVVIHLVLRPKPRRQPFPALRFILQSREAAERTNRLKRFLLLLMRIVAVATVATVLAQPQLRAVRWAPTGTAPVSVALCIDDSASMSYRFEGKSRIDVAKEWARALVDNGSRFSEGSEFVVLTNRSDAPVETLTTSRAAARRRIDSIREGAHDRPVGGMVRIADQMLSRARHPRREIYVFTDATARAWRDTSEGGTPVASGASVFCIDVGAHEDANLSLTLAPLPRRTVAVDSSPEIEFTVRAGQDCVRAVTPEVELRVDGEPKVRQTLSRVLPGDSITGTIRIPALAAGLHKVTLAVAPSDPMPFDNARFGALQVGPLPRVAVIGCASAARQGDAATARLIAGMLAPPSLSRDRQRVECDVRMSTDAETTDWSPFRCVFIADVRDLTPNAWRRLADYAQKGSWVVLILGPSVDAEGYTAGAALVPALPVETAYFDPPLRVEAPDATHLLLRPLSEPGVDSIGDRLVFRAWRLSQPGDQTAVLCRFSNGEPAILERPVDRGRCVLINACPDPDWSEFGTQAAPFIVLLHRLVELASPGTERCGAIAAGAFKSVRLPTDAMSDSDPLVEVSSGVQSEQSRTRPVTAVDRASGTVVNTDEPGHVWLASRNQPQTPLFLWAVNVEDHESDFRTLPHEQITARFAPGQARIAGTHDELDRLQRRERTGLDIVFPLGAALLSLLIAESFFANRFYRKAPPRPTRAVGQ